MSDGGLKIHEATRRVVDHPITTVIAPVLGLKHAHVRVGVVDVDLSQRSSCPHGDWCVGIQCRDSNEPSCETFLLRVMTDTVRGASDGHEATHNQIRKCRSLSGLSLM
jgi:hypothetical protein